MLPFVMVLASIAYSPGAAQYGAAANANAYAGNLGASASANSYVYYPPSTNVRDCTYNRCTPTCSVPNVVNCPADSNPCNCPPGTVISQPGGQCVPQQDCDRYINCNGDYNARYTDCPLGCPSTCAQPNGRLCKSQCGPPGCECKPGFLLSSAWNGRCIKPEQCPGGSVCGRNETFVSCLVECPDLYCPVNQLRVACGPSYPCPSACACKSGYLRRNYNDHSCILSWDCPPGNCYGANEEWNRCASICYTDKCQDRNKGPIPTDCPFNPAECYPRCICKQGYYRNANGTCIPVQQCPPL